MRFPEFEGGWVCEKLSDFTERVTRKNTNNETELPLTISSKDGLVDQISYFNKTVASKDMSGYYLLKHGEYAYNKSYSVGYSFGSIKRLDRYAMGALSTLYICFTLKKHNTDFVNTYFDSLKWYHEIHMISAEGARNHGLLNVPTEVFFETKHWLPINLDEQKKIAKFFQLLEYRIEIQQKLLDALKLYKRGLLSKLFPQKGESVPQYRFAGFTDAWEQRKFEDLADYKKGPFGSAITKDMFVPKGKDSVKVYEQQNAINKDWSLERYFLPKEYALTKLKSFEVYGGDIIVSCAGTIGEIYEIPENADTGVINQALMRVRVNEDIVDKSMFIIAFSNMIDEFTRTHSNGSAIKNIPPFADLKPMQVLIPTMAEQKKISGYFSCLDHLITLHQRKQDFCEKVKLALLQQMFI